MVQRAGSEDAKSAEAGAEGGAHVEPKEAWTPVTAGEADRVVRALLAGDAAAGGDPNGASRASEAAGEAARMAMQRAAVRKSRARTVIGGVVAVAVTAGVTRWLLSHRNSAPSATSGASLRDSGTPGGASFAQASTALGHEQDSGMNRSTAAALVAGISGFAIAGGAGAQNAAVQWKVSDGGNGHWYEIVSLAGTGKVYWSTCRDSAMSVGGDLACFTSEAETSAFIELTAGQMRGDPWIGLFQDRSAPDFGEPRGGWRWCSGEPLAWMNWAPGEPNNAGNEDWVNMWISNGPPGTWNDYQPTNPQGPDGYVIEWSADCNGDGIVDYGQCHDGTLPDYNGNNIPDCCERGEACVVGSYPLQWRADQGGNGHWYLLKTQQTGIDWSDANSFAASKNGRLGQIESTTERQFLFDLSATSVAAWNRDAGGALGPWLGGWQQSGAPEPNGGWIWTDGSPVDFAICHLVNSDPSGCGTNENRMSFWCKDAAMLFPGSVGYETSDYPAAGICGSLGPIRAALIEWSADCNRDNIVDYGQILSGQLADANGNGIPDICEGPTCRDADLFRDGTVNGADLGILLAQWGVANANTVSDINHDGRVDGSDLGTLLAFWGPCPN
jgi:hypothetical protein